MNNSWKLEDAKARFSELVRRTQSDGPQRVTVRGKAAVVIIDAAAFDELLPTAQDAVPFVQFMESLGAPAIDLERDPDRGRDFEL